MVKVSLIDCGQYWYKYDSFVNIEACLLFYTGKYARKCSQCYGIVQNVAYDYLSWLYFVLLFFYVRGKEIIKQKIPCHH